LAWIMAHQYDAVLLERVLRDIDALAVVATLREMGVDKLSS